MKKQEALNRIEAQKETIIELTGWAVFRYIEALLEQIDEPETGHSDEAPRYVKNILARLQELPEHDREVWLKVIMGEFERDFSRAKWREGYEQGKVEGMIEREKVTIPQFMAEHIVYAKEHDWDLQDAMDFTDDNSELSIWFYTDDNMELFARAWLDGYDVEEEKQYTIRFKNIRKETRYLKYDRVVENWYFGVEQCSKETKISHTRKELEEAGFGWVFDCPGIEIEEVTE